PYLRSFPTRRSSDLLEDVGEADAPIVDLLGVPDAEVAAPAAVQVIGAVVHGQLVFLPVQREAALRDAVGVAADDGTVRGPPGHVDRKSTRLNSSHVS